MIRIFALFLTCLLPALAFGQVPFPPLAGAHGYLLF